MALYDGVLSNVATAWSKKLLGRYESPNPKFTSTCGNKPLIDSKPYTHLDQVVVYLGVALDHGRVSARMADLQCSGPKAIYCARVQAVEAGGDSQSQVSSHHPTQGNH